MSDSLSALKSPYEPRRHEVEPEDVQADETGHERVQHVQRSILHVLAWLIIALFMQSVDDMDWEEPESQVDPGHDHSSVEECLHG